MFGAAFTRQYAPARSPHRFTFIPETTLDATE